MNYVGSVSIIDRGDAPAKAVIDKNTRSLAQRVADETKQELDKVMDRVDNIYVSYEMSTQTMFDNPRGSPNVEYIEDIKELEQIITDAVKKKKYQQQVTVFIVGFQDICAQKMQLLQQVNQFFIENSKLDEEELTEDKPTIDLEEASTKVNESLNTAEELTKRLSDINQDMVDYLVNYANNKASNKGRKKLEKSLESAKNDVNNLSEKLLTLQAELEEKEDKFQQLVKQLEAKSQEAIRYKTAAEVAKKSAQDNENHTSALQDEILKRDEKIQELRSKLSRLEINLTESQFDTEMSKRRLDNTNAQTKQIESQTQEKLAKLQEEVETKKMAIGDAEREMAKVHRDQLASLEKSHQEEIEELKQSHMQEIAKLTDELNSVNTMLTRAEKTAQEAFEEADGLRTKMVEIELNQPDPIEEFRPQSDSLSGKSVGELSVEDELQASKESRPSTKDTKSSRKSENRPIIKTTAKSPNRGKEKGKGKDYIETGIQDEGGDPNRAIVDKSNDPSRQPTRQSKNLEPVVETGDQEFTDSYELDDEEAWSTVPAGHVTGRFAQYRRLSVSRMRELGEQLNVTLTKTHRKVNSLKMQFTEHKNKWENERKILIEQVEQAQRLQTDAEKEADAAMTQLEEFINEQENFFVLEWERKILIEQVEQAQRLQTDAEKEADAAMTQLEEFINEQEKLEDEEETKRQEIIKTMSRPGTVKQEPPSTADRKTDRRTSVGEKRETTPQEERLQSENSEQELKNLMQQTDDAKAKTPVSRSESGNSELAPWLNSPQKRVKPADPSTDPSSDPSSQTSFDPNSRLTSVADAEIQNIAPEGRETKEAKDIARTKQKDILKPIDGLKGEREKLMSRTSTRLSRQPKRPLSRQIDEHEELSNRESGEESSRLDSQVAPWFTQTDRRQVRQPVTETPDVTPDNQTVAMETPRKGSESVMSSDKQEVEDETDEESLDELEADDLPEVKRSQSVEVIGRRSRPSVSRMQERSKSTALENVGQKKDKVLKKIKPKEKETKKEEQANKDTKQIKPVDKEAQPKDKTGQPKPIKQKERKMKNKEEKRARTSVGHIPEIVNFREGAKSAPIEELDDDINYLDNKDMNEMIIALPKDAGLGSEKNGSDSKMSAQIGDLDSRRSMAGTVARGKMTQMTDVTIPVAMDTDSENEEEFSEKVPQEIVQKMEGQDETDDVIEALTDEDKVRQRSRVSITTSPKSIKTSRAGFETGRSGALGGLGNHDNQRTPIYTSQSVNLPVGRITAQSTHQQVVSVEVLQQEQGRGTATSKYVTPSGDDNDAPGVKLAGEIAENVSEKQLEAQEKAQNGSISAAPPEDGELSKTQDFRTPREDEESRPVTPYSRKSSGIQSRKNLSQQKPETPKEAFRTPRMQSASSLSNLSEELFDLDLEKDEGVAMELSPTQTQAINNMKMMMEEEQFNIEQQKTLDSLRSALRTMSSDRPLKDIQLERTVTILSLASQIARESIELGILPDGVFNRFGNMDERAMSVMSGKEVSIKGSAISKRKTVSARPEVIYEPAGDKGDYSDQIEKDTKPEFQLKPDKKKKKKRGQRSRSRSTSPDEKRSKTPKLFEIKQDALPTDKPSSKSSAITVSGSMDMAYASTRGDSFSASIPRTLTSSEWRKMMNDDDLNTPEPGESKHKIDKQKIKKDDRIEKKSKIEKTTKTENNVAKGTDNQADVAMDTDLIRQESDISVEDVMAQTPISVVISPKKKSRQVTVEEMLYGDKTDMKFVLPEESFNSVLEQRDLLKSVHQQREGQEKENQQEMMSVNQLSNVKVTDSHQRKQGLVKEIQKTHRKGKVGKIAEKPQQKIGLDKDVPPQLDGQAKELHQQKNGLDIDLVQQKDELDKKVHQQEDLLGTLLLKPKDQLHQQEDLQGTKLHKPKDLEEKILKTKDLDEKSLDKDLRHLKEGLTAEWYNEGQEERFMEKPFDYRLDETLKITRLVKKSTEKLPTPEKRRSARTPKPLSAKTKISRRSTLSPNSLNEPPNSAEGIARQISFTSNRTLLTAPTPGTLVSDFERPPSKGSFESVDTVSVSINDVKVGGVSDKMDGASDQLGSSNDKLGSSSDKMGGSSKQLGGTSDKMGGSSDKLRSSSDKRGGTYDKMGGSSDKLGSFSDTVGGASSDKPHPSSRTSTDLSLPEGRANAEQSRPLSISSVKPVICTSPVLQVNKETQTDFTLPEIEREPIVGDTEEEIRISSARSRASLRNQFKSRLDETRHAVEERRTKSPVIAVPSQKSVDDELIDDDDDDVELPIPDDLKEEVYLHEDTMDAGTSPPPAPKPSKQSSIMSKNLSEHPVVHQYLRAYTGVHNFKEALSRIMVDKDQMSASQILAELDMLPFDRDSKIIPQIETMTENIYYVLNELSQVINSVLQNDRGPVVSSLMMGMSRDTTQRNIREKSGYTADLQPPTRSSERSISTKAESMISDSKYKELNEQYEKLQNAMSEDVKRYEEQQRHNMVVMMEMQDTINTLQRELSNLGKQGRRPVSEGASTAIGTQQQQDSAIMFTRLDSERNAKIMKKAVNEEKLDPNKYKEAIVQMDDYVNLPAQRLGHLVRKYVHHCRMKEIEDNVQKSKSLNENVFEILDKMEALQNQRAKRWADRMDEMGLERMRLANMLMETLDGIEQESGIFLIKPMYSYRGREPKDRYSTKVTRPLRPQRTLSPLRDSNSAYAPAPTPASNVRPSMGKARGDANMIKQVYNSNVSPYRRYSQSQEYVPPRAESQPLEATSAVLTGSSVNYVGVQPKATWSMSDSQPRMDGGLHGGTISNTPRILELDINRMMIGQNTISANIGYQQPSNDRLVNAPSNNLRSYMTVNRPTGPSSAGKAERPTSGSRGGLERSSSSPISYSPSSKHVRMADIDVPTVIPNTQPLPPIGTGSLDRPNSSEVYRRSPARIPSGDDIPTSPPGSSLRQSPAQEQESET